MTPTTNNVGPTTSATERLRALLDECGVEYDVRDGKTIKNTYWDDAEGRRWGYTSDESGVIKDRQLFLVRGRMDITPEQAVAATLGETPTPPSPTPPKQPPYDLLIDLLRDEWDIEASWDGLRRFWYVGLTDEGVRKREERDATLGRGECHEVIVDEYWRGCGNCGYVWEYMYGIGKCTRPNFCPRCGAKVVDE